MSSMFVNAFADVNVGDFMSYRINENTTRNIFDGMVIDDEWTDNYRKFTTYCGDNVTVDYYDFATGIMTTTKNGEYITEINIDEERERITEEWTIPETDLMAIKNYLK